MVMYELRIYQTAPGRTAELVDNAERFAVPLQRKHGFDVAGFWTVAGEGAGSDADVVYLLRWQSQADRELAWHSFLADPEWTARQAQTGAVEPLVKSETVHLLAAAPFSALQ